MVHQPPRPVNGVARRRVNIVVRRMGILEMDDYRNRLVAAKECYPFSKWAEWGIE